MNQNPKLYAATLGGKATGAILRERAIEARRLYNETPNHCLYCNAPSLVSMNDLKPQVFQATKRKKFCNRSCAAAYNNRNRPHKPPKSKFNRKRIGYAYLSKTTKGELFARSKNWQAARSTIQHHAAHIYETSGQPRVCLVCAYNLHTEVCHRTPVSRFPDTAMVSEINHPDNLVALCRNHHWELDHGDLKLGASGRI